MASGHCGFELFSFARVGRKEGSRQGGVDEERATLFVCALFLFSTNANAAGICNHTCLL